MSDSIIEYREKIICEMKKIGADYSDLNLLNDRLLKIAFKERRDPEVVAWVLMQ